MKISATELNKRPGAYLIKAIQEPVIIEKSGSPSAVLVSYEYFMRIEDSYWGKLAASADAEKSIGVKRTKEFLESDE